MLATFSDGAWARAALTGMPGVGKDAVGQAKGIANEDKTPGPPVNTAVAVDGQGNHHVAWASTEGVYYATDAAGSAAQPEVAVKGSTLGVSLALGSDSSPWISFVQGSKVRVAHRSGTTWTVDEVGTTDATTAPGTDTAIGVGADGPVVAFGDKGKTVVAKQSGGAWKTDDVPGEGGFAVSMALDRSGNPHLAYYDRGGESFHAHRLGGAPWTVNPLEATASSATGPDVRWGSGIALDDSGVHHIVVADTAKGGAIKYITNESGNLVADVVPTSQGGANPSIAVSPDGKHLAISFFDETNQNVVVAVPSDTGLALAFSPPATTPAPTQAPTAQCEPAGTELAVVAKGVAFDKDCLAAPAQKAFTLEFDNQDSGVPHNVEIFTDSSATERLGGAKDAGDFISGPAKVTYDVDPLDAGSYFFRCDLHPAQMFGTFIVA
jgi:hypothetical protein